MNTTFRVSLVHLGWLGLAIVAGASGVVAQLRPPTPQIILFGLTGAVLLAFWRVTAFRSWVIGLPLRSLVLLHATRIVAGASFLFLQGRGQLPYAFAVPGGWGDIVVGAMALILCCGPMKSAHSRRAVIAWNALGLIDILFVVLTASRLALANAESMSALLQLPLSLLPTFLVPLIIATHVIIFVRLRHGDARNLGDITPTL